MGSSSLVSYCATVSGGQDLPLVRMCPRKPYWVVNNDSPLNRQPASCDCVWCPVCIDRVISRKTRMMLWACRRDRWTRSLMLSRIPGEWQQARAQVRDFFRRLRRTCSIEMAWAIEENPERTGFHLHGMGHGEFAPWRRIRQLWGDRYTYISAIDSHAVGYMTKMARLAGYPTKNSSPLQHLELNGGRCIHWTRGFLHGFTEREVLKRTSLDLGWHTELDPWEDSSSIGVMSPWWHANHPDSQTKE
jgi:hypothetical protein